MDQAGNGLTVVGICGSIRGGSYTRMAVRIALQAAEEAGARTRLIDLKDYHLVLCVGKEDESDFPKDASEITVDESGQVVVSTPPTPDRK